MLLLQRKLTLLKFENFDVLPVTPNLVWKTNCFSILMKTDKINNEIALFMIMQIKFGFKF